MAADYVDWLPRVAPHTWRRIRGEQEIIARFEPEQALQTCRACWRRGPTASACSRSLDKLAGDPRVHDDEPTSAQAAMFARVREVLTAPHVRLAAASVAENRPVRARARAASAEASAAPAPARGEPRAAPEPAPAPARASARSRKQPATPARGRRTKAAA